MPANYGYFLGTLANDGDHVDVFIGPKPEAVETRAVDMHMVKLRRKLEDVLDREVIETIRGAGYRLVELGT